MWRSRETSIIPDTPAAPPRRSAVLLGVLALSLSILAGAAPAAGSLRRGLEPEALSDSAVQTVYRAGVPHTDSRGNIRTGYDSASFFPRCIYHAVAGSFRLIEEAGFNCVHTWEGYGVRDVIGDLRATGLQLIRHWPTDAEVAGFAEDPNILAWYLDEEPTAQTYVDMQRGGNADLMAERFEAFVSRKAAIKAIDPRHPVFPLDAGWVPPGLEQWWERWNTSGDITVLDDYPLLAGAADITTLPHSILRAVRLNGERKPLWLTLQAFGGTAGKEPPMRLPSAAELRGMVFTAIIHGATGVTLFAYDSEVTREGLVIGIAPETPERYGSHAAATPAEADRSRALWKGAAELNAELERLTPRLLSPTAGLHYAVYYSGESRTRSPIRTLLKDGDGRYTLLAANLDGTSHGVRFQFTSDIASVTRLDGQGSESALPASGSTFRDVLDPLAAAVYEVRFR